MFKVLLVEDSNEDRFLVQRALVDSGFAVQEAATAATALQAIDADGADVVLLDLTLPNGAGISLVRKVLGKAATIPVVLLTGSNDENLVAQALKDGIAGFVSKHPQVNRLALLTAMHLAIKNRKTPAADDTLRLLEERICQMKVTGDEVIQELESKVLP